MEWNMMKMYFIFSQCPSLDNLILSRNSLLNDYAKSVIQNPFSLGKSIDTSCAQCEKDFKDVEVKDKNGIKAYHCEGSNCKSYLCYDCYHSLKQKLCPICYSIYAKNNRSSIIINIYQKLFIIIFKILNHFL